MIRVLSLTPKSKLMRIDTLWSLRWKSKEVLLKIELTLMRVPESWHALKPWLGISWSGLELVWLRYKFDLVSSIFYFLRKSIIIIWFIGNVCV